MGWLDCRYITVTLTAVRVCSGIDTIDNMVPCTFAWLLGCGVLIGHTLYFFRVMPRVVVDLGAVPRPALRWVLQLLPLCLALYLFVSRERERERVP